MLECYHFEIEIFFYILSESIVIIFLEILSLKIEHKNYMYRQKKCIIYCNEVVLPVLPVLIKNIYKFIYIRI